MGRTVRSNGGASWADIETHKRSGLSAIAPSSVKQAFRQKLIKSSLLFEGIPHFEG